MWKPLQDKILSKTVPLLYIITETVRFYNYMRSSRKQVPGKIQSYDKRFPSRNFRHPLGSKGCPKFTVFRYQSIKSLAC